MVVVQGATSARRSRGIAASRDHTTTGRRPTSASSHHQTSPRNGAGIRSPRVLAGSLSYSRTVTVHELSRQDARRIAVRAQLLDRGRPDDLHDVVRRLTLLQIDPTAAIAPNADLVAWSRLGSSYSRRELTQALQNRTLLELRAMIRPAEDLALYRADMAAWAAGEVERGWQKSIGDWVHANDVCRRDILARLDASGPLPSRELPDTCAKPWRSTGWTNNRNVTQMLEFMVLRGEVAIAGRQGNDRLWDLAARVYPDDPAVPADEARQRRNERRLRALGIARARGPECPVEPIDVGEVGEPAVVEGVKGQWRVDPSLLGQPFKGRAALLSPFDRLIHDRKRLDRAVRVRLPARDVQAGGQASLGILRAADPVRRPARRQARRHRRPQGRRAAGRRHPPRRRLHQDDDRRRRSRDRRPGPLARTRSRLHRLTGDGPSNCLPRKEAALPEHLETAERVGQRPE